MAASRMRRMGLAVFVARRNESHCQTISNLIRYCGRKKLVCVCVWRGAHLEDFHFKLNL